MLSRKPAGFYLVSLVILVSLFSTILVGCSNQNGASNQNGTTSFDKAIKEPIQVDYTGQAAMVGDLTAALVQVQVPAGGLPAETKSITLTNPASVPGMSAQEASLIAAPVDVSVGADETVRLNQLLTVTLKFDTHKLPANTESGSLWASFYSNGKWQYFRPDKVDMTSGTMTFATDHLCLFGAVKVDIEERIKNISHSKAVASWVQKKTDKAVDSIAEKAVDQMLKNGLGLKEDSIKSKVLGSLLKDDEYATILEKYHKGDAEGFSQDLSVFVGKKIAENVDKSTLSSALTAVSSSKGVSYVAAGAKAAGALAEGNYRDAGRYIGETIANKYIIVQATKIVIKGMQYEIQSWTDSKLEAAFAAYRDGKESQSPFGYSVDAGDFNAVWTQMRGLQNKLQSDAIEKEKAIRLEGGQAPPTEAEMEIIRSKVKSDLEASFKQRLSQENEIKKQEADIANLIESYKKAHLLESPQFRYNDDNLEIRLDNLLHFRDVILDDTANNPKGKKLTNDDIVILTQAYFSGSMEEGKKKYAELLLKNFGIGGAAPVSSTPAPSTSKPTATGNHPIIQSFTGPTDSSVFKTEATARYSLKITGGTAPYKVTWFANMQQIFSGKEYETADIPVNRIRFNGQGYFIYVMVEDSAGKQAEWIDSVGISHPEFTYGVVNGTYDTEPHFPYKSVGGK
jgi:hypothetical protein